MRWGEKLEYVAEAGEGDFIFVPPYVPHQEINAMEGEELECVLVRSDGEAVAVNLPDLEPVVSGCGFLLSWSGHRYSSFDGGCGWQGLRIMADQHLRQ